MPLTAVSFDPIAPLTKSATSSPKTYPPSNPDDAVLNNRFVGRKFPKPSDAWITPTDPDASVTLTAVIKLYSN